MRDIDEIRRDNLRQLEDELGGPSAAAKQLEMSVAQFANLRDGAKDSKTGKPRGMRKETARRIEQAGSKPVGWLDQDHTISSSTEVVVVHAVSPTPQPGEPAIHIPLLANAGSMGPGTDIEHDDVMVGSLAISPDWLDKRIRPTSFDALRFIHAYGDSMSPTFEDGDVLLVDTGRRDPSGADGVYVLATSKRLFIKRVTERFNGGHDVTSDNANVKLVQELNGNHEINVLGRVVWVWHGRKL